MLNELKRKVCHEDRKIFVAERVDAIVREVLCFAGIEDMYQEHLRRYVEELSLCFVWQLNLN